jgi:hypothetical protein
VALLRQPMPDGVRQQIAAEMNLAETAFVEVCGPQGCAGCGNTTSLLHCQDLIHGPA